MSPDPENAGTSILDPQTWNAYAYVRNAPLNLVDPDGRKCVNLDGGGVGDDGEVPLCNDLSVWTSLDVGVSGDVYPIPLVNAESRNLPSPPNSARSKLPGRLPTVPAATKPPTPPQIQAANSGCVSRQAIIDEATKWSGTPYSQAQPSQCNIRGDCSGTVRAIYRNVGINIALGNNVVGKNFSNALGIYNSPSLSHASTGRIGDIAYWRTPYHHVAIFAGNGNVWSARSTKSGKPFGLYPMQYFGAGGQPSYLTSPQVCK
jgi:hypothetical protein